MRIKELLGILTITVGLGLVLQGCNKIAKESTSGTKLIISAVGGINWQGNESSVLDSDVLVETSKGTTVQDDLAVVHFTATPYSPDVTTTSVYYNVMLKEYHVKYIRSDNRNVEGVDVPYSFWGRVTDMIPADGADHTVSVVVVRSNAKMERPLVELRYAGGTKSLEVTAELEFYGEDVGGHPVYAKGYLPIVFANYANE